MIYMKAYIKKNDSVKIIFLNGKKWNAITHSLVIEQQRKYSKNLIKMGYH